jgi:tol-pal system protein YbgF
MRHAWRLAVLLAALCAMPAQAGIFDDEEARVRIEKLRSNLDDLIKRVDIATKNQIDFSNQSETLKADLARLRGQIEVVVYELEATQKRQKDFYVDLDNRLRKLESTPAAKSETAPESAKVVDPAQETADYETALSAFKAAKYKDALAGFMGFIKTYPASTLKASAHFWAASSHYQLREFAKAAEAFGVFAATWPADSRAPDALLASANALADAGDAKGSRKALEALVEKYPASQPAQGAKARLKTAPTAPAKRR